MKSGCKNWKFSIAFLAIPAFIFMNSCSSDVKQHREIKSADFHGSINANDSLLNSFEEPKAYILPAPLQVSTLLKNSSLVFKQEFLMGDKEPLQSTNFDKALVLGLYSIDAGYSVVYNQQQKAINYLKVIQNLMNELGIKESKEKSLLKRFEENADQPDSLSKIILQAYEASHQHFQKNSREGLGLLIMVGCYIEGLYLATQIEEFQNEKVYFLTFMQQQKLFLDNILELMGFYVNSNEVKELHAVLESLQEKFNKMGLEKQTKMSGKDLATIKASIKEIRDGLVSG